MARIGTRRAIGKGQNAAIPTLNLTATTTGAGQTVTLQRITPTGGTCTVSWGDGGADSVIANGNTGTTTHAYAAAAAYNITISNPSLITYLDLRDTKLSCAAGEIGGLTSLTSLVLRSVAGVTVGAGEIGGLTSLTYLALGSVAGVTVGAGEIGGLTSLTYLALYNVAGVSTQTSDFAALVKLNSLTYQNSLSQAQVDAALYGVYQAALSRTTTGGTVAIASTNAAPSGVYQACAACPVGGATPGKEIAHELLNDGCNAIAPGETWATVTFTA
jgi:hypothetical protein